MNTFTTLDFKVVEFAFFSPFFLTYIDYISFYMFSKCCHLPMSCNDDYLEIKYSHLCSEGVYSFILYIAHACLYVHTYCTVTCTCGHKHSEDGSERLVDLQVIDL